jgi:hypothetical protein
MRMQQLVPSEVVPFRDLPLTGGGDSFSAPSGPAINLCAAIDIRCLISA